MNIAFIIRDYNYHGGAQKTATIAQHLQSQGHSVNIIVIRCRGGDNEKKKRPKYFSNILDLNATGFFNGIFRLIKIFRNSQYDASISIGPYSNISAGLAKFLCRGTFALIGSENFAKSPLIGDYPKLYFRLLLPLFWLSYNQLNGLLFVTDRLRLEFLNKNSWHPSRCITIYNPVKFSKKNFRQNKKKQNTSGLTFLGVGILEQRKRFDLLIRAFSKVANNKDKLLIAGEGSLENELKKLVKQLGLRHQVHFLGYNSDIESLMKKSDILVHTSNSEAFGMVLAEGLATGMQVVSTNSFSGPGEILGNGRYGFLAEVDNLGSIISALRLAINSPKSQEIIFEGVIKFSVSSITEKYIRFISSVIANKGNLNETL
jgi:glycosyltransferase involved in cell wall biosynthesis